MPLSGVGKRRQRLVAGCRAGRPADAPALARQLRRHDFGRLTSRSADAAESRSLAAGSGSLRVVCGRSRPRTLPDRVRALEFVTPPGATKEVHVTTDAPTPSPIVLIHGLWLTPLSWEYWVEHFEGKGHRVLA